MRVKKQQLEPDMEQLFGSSGKEVSQGSLLSSCLFNFYAEWVHAKLL